MNRNRIIIYAKDVQRITGRSLRAAQRLLQIIRKALGKHQDQFVTVDEFCEFTGLTRDDLEESLQ